MSDLAALGWGEFFSKQLEQAGDESLRPARVAIQHRDRVTVLSEAGETMASLSGIVRAAANAGAVTAAVGDWVLLRDGGATVDRVLKRRTAFVRQAARDESREQVIAANVDTVLVVTACGADFNLRRIERYLTAIADSGADAAVVLNKVDLADDAAGLVAQLSKVAPGTPVFALSALRGDGIDQLEPLMGTGVTLALVGSSGVGKSTLINALLGTERQRVGEVRADDDKGRHTTTHRELLLIPGDRGLVIDTPGMRALRLRANPKAAAAAFSDIEQLAASCRFRNCTHTSEPGCAVRDAVPAERVQSFTKLEREIEFENRRRDEAAKRQESRRLDKIYRSAQRARERKEGKE